MNKAVQAMEKKYGNRAKVKAGKLYGDMHRVMPSSAMAIVGVYPDGSYKEITTSLVHDTEPVTNYDTIFYMYIGNTYLTINTYKPREIMKTTGWLLSHMGVEREETSVRPRIRSSGERMAHEKAKSESTPAPDNTGDVDVPW